MISNMGSPMATALAIVLAFASPSDAFWRMECRSRSGFAQIDPLVSYGGVSEHIHAIHGGSAFSPTATTDDLLKSDCTSCSVAQDKSAYWTPAFYFQDAATGKFEVVNQVGGMLAYYLLFPNSNDKTNKVNAFPKGFQMIAGDVNQRNFTYPVPDVEKSLWTGEFADQKFLRQAAVGFNCLNYGAAPEGTLYRHFLPDKAFLDANCKDGIRAELMFPSCWNGETTSPDSKSHVAYPSQVMTGDCPKEFPKRLVSMLYETIWATNEFVGRDGQFVISNGDPTGYGYHGDFVTGWDEDFLQSAVNTCTNPSGKIEDCALFKIQEASVYNTCNIEEPASIKSLKVTGELSSLPGNPPVVKGPEYAKGATSSSPKKAPIVEAAPVPTLPYSSGISISPAESSAYVPGAVFAAKPSAGASSSPVVNIAAVETPAPKAPEPIPSPPKDTASYVSTQYITNGFTVSEILWAEELMTVTVPVTATATAFAKRHVHQHRRGN